MLHTLIGDGPKPGMQQPWFPLEPESSFSIGNPVSYSFSILQEILTLWLAR